MTQVPDQPHESPFAPPRVITSLDDCYFYHTMDVPGFGVVKGEWDLRSGIDRYLGHFDFGGKRVLDVGAASGMLTFAIERGGGEVVAFDLSEEHDWDLVPFAAHDVAASLSQRRAHLRRINNGFWLCHHALGSRARMVNGSVYALPQTIGPVDVSVFGSILLHLRDPFLALENAARLTRQTMIVADLSPYGRVASAFRRSPRFMPRGNRPDGINDGWYRLPPLLVREFLTILGFPDMTMQWNVFDYGGRKRSIYTIVAHRA